MKNGYSFNPKTQSYQYVVDGQVKFSTRNIAVCYSINEDNSADVLKVGIPEDVSRLMRTVNVAQSAAFLAPSNDEVHYFEGDIPEEDLNSILQNPDHVIKLHPLFQRLMMINSRIS